ncbi:unnamed protein product [Rotaria socialis]|uniref:Uncharacterized protein n=1 Tax=Rotaria socialis TaxID=392032 RepID=A0A820H1Q5_9BILA|nr:unnamed protein product [Rotaria socialis]CAF4287924.1 unnamed protein product [Rotaria socialis]
MVTTTSTSTSIGTGYDEILSTTSTLEKIDASKLKNIDNSMTSYLLAIFPLYTCAILLNFLTIYSILMAKVYRQYLSNVLLAVICIGALINLNGQIFLILMRWAIDSSSDQLCSISIYLRDNGSILIQTHILFLVFERILANLKKDSTNLNRPLIQKAHLFLIVVSLVSIILSLTVPIFTLTHSAFSRVNGLCAPKNLASYTKYLTWIYYGFGHPFVLSACGLLGIFLCRKTTISYSTLIPMNKIVLIISLSSYIDLLIRTLFDDIVGVKNQSISNKIDESSRKLFFSMNLRDSISIVDKIIIGLVFFLFRPEIRLWLMESVKKFQSNKNEIMIPQMLDIRSELDDNYHETDDANIHFPADT